MQHSSLGQIKGCNTWNSPALWAIIDLMANVSFCRDIVKTFRWRHENVPKWCQSAKGGSRDIVHEGKVLVRIIFRGTKKPHDFMILRIRQRGNEWGPTNGLLISPRPFTSHHVPRNLAISVLAMVGIVVGNNFPFRVSTLRTLQSLTCGKSGKE